MYKRLAAEIDLDAVDFNIKSILKRIDGRAQVIGTIKADGYGHGAMEVAEVLMENGVNMFSVAAIDEDISLRKKGLKAPILLLGLSPEEFDGELMEYDIIPAVSSLEQARGI